jgi:hypothetical protein
MVRLTGPSAYTRNLNGLKLDSGEWVHGASYDPESGKTYYCAMELNEEGMHKVRGSADLWAGLGAQTLGPGSNRIVSLQLKTAHGRFPLRRLSCCKHIFEFVVVEFLRS